LTETYALLVVGGGPAGIAAARGFRSAGGQGPIAIISDEERAPYQRPPLTKELLRGESTEAALPIEDEAWFERERVALVGGRAVGLDAERRLVSLSGGRELRYRECLLATGAEPARLPVDGADHPRVRVIRTLDHVRELNAQLDDGDRVVVIGSGFIGCEIASSLRIRGHEVLLVSDEKAPNSARLGTEAAERLRGWLGDDNVQLHLQAPVERIEARDRSVAVVAGGQRIVGRLVVMAVGVGPRSELATQTGLGLVDGAIPVTAAMRTECDGLLAAGDVCSAHNLTAGRPIRVEHWGDALAQGDIAGRTAAGAKAGWDAVPGFWSTIGRHTLKYAAWGDGYDSVCVQQHADDGFTAWYGDEGTIVGVLTHCVDEDYERGGRLIAQAAPWRF
jgi:3-phenylpropionate/trans-cinnamate dioxygenase ferredoxin reductase component